MASRPYHVIESASVAAFVVCPFCKVWRYSNGVVYMSEPKWAAFWSTLKPAILSAFIPVFFALFLCRALAPCVFWWHSFMILILDAPFILPVIAIILGLIAVFRQNGVLNFLWTSMGFKQVSIYGLQGKLVVHLFRLAPRHKNNSFGLGFHSQ